MKNKSKNNKNCHDHSLFRCCRPNGFIDLSPKAIQRQFETFEPIPEELKSRDQWICGKWFQVGKDERMLPVKCDLGQIALADIGDRKSLSSYEDAVIARARWSFNSLLFVLTEDDPFCSIGLPTTYFNEWWIRSNKLVQRFASYTEFFTLYHWPPTYHILIKGKMPREDFANPLVRVSSLGWVPMTGQHLEGTPKTVENRQKELEELCAKFTSSM